MTRAQRRRLPKARLFWVEVWDRRMPCFFVKFRMANARQWHFGRLVVHMRAPWLEGPARQMHPEVFK
jgi:hypothetical protein